MTVVVGFTIFKQSHGLINVGVGVVVIVALGLEELGFFSKNVKLLGVYYADKARFL